MQEMNRKINKCITYNFTDEKYKCNYFRTCFGTNNVRILYIF